MIECGLAYPVMSFLYWHEVGIVKHGPRSGERWEARWMSAISFGEWGEHEDLTHADSFKGHVFPSKKAARRWCKDNGLEFNEGEL